MEPGGASANGAPSIHGGRNMIFTDDRANASTVIRAKSKRGYQSAAFRAAEITALRIRELAGSVFQGEKLERDGIAQYTAIAALHSGRYASKVAELENNEVGKREAESFEQQAERLYYALTTSEETASMESSLGLAYIAAQATKTKTAEAYAKLYILDACLQYCLEAQKFFRKSAIIDEAVSVCKELLERQKKPVITILLGKHTEEVVNALTRTLSEEETRAIINDERFQETIKRFWIIEFTTARSIHHIETMGQ